MKRILCIALVLFIPVISFTSGRPHRPSYKIKTIVIDPGHGGHDSGCLGSSAKEKNVALSISLKLGKLIEQNYPDVKVIFTRKTDVFIPLYERADIANRNHADLFMCIHLNSGNKAAYGAETYVMGLHKTEDNLNVAKRENASILLEDNYKTQYDGFDPNSPEANIIFSLYQNQFMHQSLSLASKVQEQFDEYAGRNNRGVKQAGFLVLYKTAMPAVLIESGFLTNDLEEKYLDSDKGESATANSIFRAFREYKIDMENSGGDKSDNQKDDGSIVPDPAPKTPVITKKNDNNDSVITTSQSKPAVQKDSELVVETDKTAIKKKTDIVPKEVKNPAKSTLVKKPEEVKPKVAKENPPQEKQVENDNATVFITVQIGASTNPAKDNANFLKNKEVKAVKCDDGYTRYLIGSFSSTNDAHKKQNQLKTSGYKDAFLTAIKGNKRITVPEAEQMLKRQ